MDDRTMMETLAQDEAAWYMLLIERYTPYVTAVISGMAKGCLAAGDIEEIAADVFFKVWQKRQDIRPESVKAFIAKVTRNACIDRLRRMGETPIPLDDDVLRVVSTGPLEEIAIAREQKQIMEEAVDAFGEPNREIFIRFYYFGETINAISGVLQLSASATKVRLHRLRQKLKRILWERGYGCEEKTAQG